MKDNIENNEKLKKPCNDENEIEDIENHCFQCKKEIKEKPWITLSCDNGDFYIHGCSYHCSKDLGTFMNGSYWSKVVNKEDFLKDPIPYQFEKELKEKEICFNDYEINQIKEEIEEEEKRIQRYEEEFNYSSDDNGLFDEYYS